MPGLQATPLTCALMPSAPSLSGCTLSQGLRCSPPKFRAESESQAGGHSMGRHSLGSPCPPPAGPLAPRASHNLTELLRRPPRMPCVAPAGTPGTRGSLRRATAKDQEMLQRGSLTCRHALPRGHAVQHGMLGGLWAGGREADGGRLRRRQGGPLPGLRRGPRFT